jgi:phosphohistidine phosphatase
MSLYFFRHGEAFQMGEEGLKSDEERFLTPKGIKVTKQVCQALQTMEVQGDLILTSPLVRARQTADIVSEVLEIPALQVEEGLAYEDAMEDLYLSLSDRAYGKDVFLVGHQPHLGDWVARLVGGTQSGLVQLSKSGVARVDLLSSPGQVPIGELRWLMTAKQLKQMG